MKRYLAVTDGSRGAEKAILYAIERAREPRAEVHVLHVVPPVAYDELEKYAERSDIVKIRREAHQRILASAADQLKAANIPCASHLLVDLPLFGGPVVLPVIGVLMVVRAERRRARLSASGPPARGRTS